jgi:type IV secretory pathway TraG/TraD family ATPase VirD4
MVKSLETALNNDSREQLSGVISTIQSAMSVLNTPEIFYPLSGNDFSLEVNNPTSSQKTAEYVSKLFGKTDQYFESHSESRGRSSTITTNSKSEGTSKNFSIQERERIKHRIYYSLM